MKVHLCKTGSKNKKNIFDIWLLISWLWRDTHTPLEGVRSCSSFPLFGYALKPTSCLNRLPWTLVTPKAPNFGDYNFSQLLKETKKKWKRDSSEGFLYAYSTIRHENKKEKRYIIVYCVGMYGERCTEHVISWIRTLLHTPLITFEMPFGWHQINRNCKWVFFFYKVNHSFLNSVTDCFLTKIDFVALSFQDSIMFSQTTYL